MLISKTIAKDNGDFNTSFCLTTNLWREGCMQQFPRSQMDIMKLTKCGISKCSFIQQTCIFLEKCCSHIKG